MLTLREIAQQIGKPETTVRDMRWKVDRYLIDKQVAGKRFVQFTDTAVDVFRDYAMGKDQGLDDTEIHELLGAKYPVTIKGDNDGNGQRGKSDDGLGRTTTPASSQTTSIDIYTRLQVTSYQIIQQQAQALTTALDKMSQLIELNQKLTEQNQEIIKLLNVKQLETTQPNRNKAGEGKGSEHRLRVKRPTRGNTAANKAPQKRKPTGGFFSRLFR